MQKRAKYNAIINNIKYYEKISNTFNDDRSFYINKL
jgi:hypothetical protein